MKKGTYLNDTIHGLISLTEYEKRIISTIGFNRLHDVYQNSTVYLTFPTNRTKRFEHSIGTMKLCSDMLYHSLLNTEETVLNQFYQRFEQEYQTIVSEIGSNASLCEEKLGGIAPTKMPQLAFDKFSHSLIPNNVPEKYRIIQLILIESIRAAALLHDIGHPPFSHIVEFALKDVYMEYKDKEEPRTEHQKEFLEVMSKYFEDNKKLHEQMGDEISEGILRKIIAPYSGTKEQYEETLFELLVLESVNRIFKEKGAFQYIHRVLDAGLDGDRLDYVTRDSFNSGMDYGKIEYSRMIYEMKIMMREDEICFCLPLKTVNAVEDFIKRRYNSYKDIIYHHRVIKTDFLLEGIVKELVKKYLDTETDGKREDTGVLIPFDVSGLWFPLGNKKTAIKANALSQWNDSWLMTVLKQIYYTEYYHNESIKEGSKEYILEQRLTELLRNSKRYYSLIKRSENFKLIDDAVKKQLRNSKEELLNQYEKEDSFDWIRQLVDATTKGGGGFILSFLVRHKDELNLPSVEQMIQDIVQRETDAAFEEIETYDTVTLFKRISIGLDKPIYFYNHKGMICTLEDVSGIADILTLDSDYLPVFYIYILARNADEQMKENREALLSNIGYTIGDCIVKKLKDH